MLRRSAVLALTLALVARTLPAQPNPPEVDQKRVDQAIERGARFLKQQVTGFGARENTSELVVYTLLHAGVPINDPVLAQGLAWVKSLDVERLSFKDKTYRVAVAAMVLEAITPELHQRKLAQFGYFLVSNQCENGQWSYGENVVLPESLVAIETGPPRPGAGKTRPLIPIRCPRRIGPPEGDFSNTQFALLGLRACALAGFDIPAETWKLAERILEQGQHPDGGWGYKANTKLRMTGPEGKGTAPGGRGGKGPAGVLGPDPEESYGSMTCSGVCGLVICKYYLHEDRKNDRRILKGLDWLAERFTVESNPRSAKNPKSALGPRGMQWHYYYLYALERTGLLCETERMGTHAWYPEGAELLLDQQYPNGGWESDQGRYVEDTCFAILFLRRATKPVEPTRTTK